MNMLRQLANVLIFSISSIRTWGWSMVTASIGKNTYIREGCIINHPALVSIGSNVYIGRFCELDGFGGLTIGNDVHIASFSAIYTSNHKYTRRDLLMREQGYTGKKVVIEDDVWIGSHAVILPGVTIHKGAIVGAGSVVSNDVAAFSIVAGVPAKLIKSRFSANK